MLGDRAVRVTISVLDLLRVGIGPSSSHTVAPMVAARRFAEALTTVPCDRIQLTFYGSLGSTGIGHGTDRAVLLGLAGEDPATVEPETTWRTVARRLEQGLVLVEGSGELTFDRRQDLVFDPSAGPVGHPNEMWFRAYRGSELVHESGLLSIGGGFLRRADDDVGESDADTAGVPAAPFDFTTGADLLARCAEQRASVHQVAFANEIARHGPEFAQRLAQVREAMNDCLDAGLTATGTLPGVLGVRRRAAELHRRLQEAQARGESVETVEWIGAWALAVSEQNAAGQRVVTAPTNGAAGVLPAALRYARVVLGVDEAGQDELLVVAGAIGSILKQTSAISGAQIGCQGEIGSAAAMAAAGLASVMGGSARQVVNAAEIAVEHHLGLACDPVAGLVQVPCIERNAVGALKALQSARLAVRGADEQRVSLDQVIEAMNQIGADMSSKYRETALGGLALSVTVC